MKDANKKILSIFLLGYIYDIVTCACMFYFKQSNSAKWVLALEMVSITFIFSEPSFAFVVSTVYMLLHHELLFKKGNLDHNYSKCLLSMSEGRKNQIIYNSSFFFFPELLCY